MNQYPAVLFFSFLLAFSTHAQQIDPLKLNEEISGFNNNNQFEASLLKLEEIITGSEYSDLDKYHAYLNKAFTFKRVFNYPATLANLDLALEHGVKTSLKEEIETRILAEKMFVYFDLIDMEEVSGYMELIKEENLHTLDIETLGFYYIVVAVTLMNKGDVPAADEVLEKAKEVMKEKSPQHVAAVYAKIIGLSERTGDVEKAEEAYHEGMYYAQKYNMDIYKIRLYLDMSSFYFSIKDYKNGLFFENLANALNGEYNAPFKSGQLNILEQDLLNKKLNKEGNEKSPKNGLLFGFMVLVLSALGLLFYKRSRKRKSEQKEILSEELEIQSDTLTDTPISNPSLETPNFTPRQEEIIHLLKQGKSNKEIATELFISENTVKYHLKAIYQLMGVSSRHEIR